MNTLFYILIGYGIGALVSCIITVKEISYENAVRMTAANNQAHGPKFTHPEDYGIAALATVFWPIGVFALAVRRGGPRAAKFLNKITPKTPQQKLYEEEVQKLKEKEEAKRKKVEEAQRKKRLEAEIEKADEYQDDDDAYLEDLDRKLNYSDDDDY